MKMRVGQQEAVDMLVLAMRCCEASGVEVGVLDKRNWSLDLVRGDVTVGETTVGRPCVVLESSGAAAVVADQD